MADVQVVIRLPASWKAEIEHLVAFVGLWRTRSDFVREAIRVLHSNETSAAGGEQVTHWDNDEARIHAWTEGGGLMVCIEGNEFFLSLAKKKVYPHASAEPRIKNRSSMVRGRVVGTLPNPPRRPKQQDPKEVG